jgi:hypothetical protein
MVKWFEVQEEYSFYGCSVLLTYEGTATKPEDLKVSAKMIDFAHSFDKQGKKARNSRPVLYCAVFLVSPQPPICSLCCSAPR